MTPADIAAALVRTTLATSAAALAAWALLAWLRIDAPRVHRIAWLLVIAQGWLFFPLTIEIETTLPSAATKRAAGFMPAGTAEQATTSFLDEAKRGREPFATGELPPLESPQSQKVPDPFPLAIAAWLLGALGLAIVATGRYLQVLRALPLGSSPDDPAWQAEWQTARAAAQLRRRQTVDLRITASLGPLLHWAPWAYLILVPRELWSALASPSRQAILRHELAHLRRGDLWKSLAIRALALPQWFNPLAWLAVRRFDEAAEWACDDAAAATAASRLTFAESLLQSAEYALAPFPASAPAARGVLTRRIRRLVSPRFKEESKMKLLIVPTLLAAAALAQIIRIESVVAEEPKAVPEKDAELSVKRVGDSLLLVQRLAHEKASDEPSEDADRKLKISPRWLESHRRLQPHDTIKLRVARPHRPAHALTWGDLEGEFTVNSRGNINTGHAGGNIAVAGMTVDEARDAIEQEFRKESPDCELQLALGTLAAEKYVISIQRADGTELAVGALAPDYASKLDFLELSMFRSFIADLTPISEIKLERAGAHGGTESIRLSSVWDAIQAPQAPANERHVRSGDRLVVTVADDWEPRVYPFWLEPCVGGRSEQTRYRIGPGWSQIGGTQFDHPDVQRPAVGIRY